MKVSLLHPRAVVPEYKSSGSSGFDLSCCESFSIRPGEVKVVRTGLSFEVPAGFELQVRPRSGLSAKTDLLVILGTVDSDYRGEVGIICRNIGKNIIGYDAGSRVAQGIIAPVSHVPFEVVSYDELEKTDRGAGGFGSTGVAVK